MKIGVDILGGDFAPDAVVLGSLLAQKELNAEDKLVLIGDEEKAKELIAKEGGNLSHFEFVHTTERIEMHEHPAKAFSRKRNSSIAIGFHLLSHHQINGFASAGSTGAMLVGAMYTVKSVPGVIRPAIATVIPRMGEKPSIMLDVGLNPDCKPDVLYQYGIIGSKYAENVYGIENPKVALLNIGAEKEKGNLLTKAAHEAMQETTDFNFIGNIEGTDIFSGKADIIVCDGFVGNVVLKEAEALFTLLKKRNIKDEYFEQFNFERYGGTPILGINSNVVIGHGISKQVAIKNMILHTKDVIEAKLPEKFKQIFK